jgi:hypothetical protein
MIVLCLIHLILVLSLYTAITLQYQTSQLGWRGWGGSHMYCYGYIYIIASIYT